MGGFRPSCIFIPSGFFFIKIMAFSLQEVRRIIFLPLVGETICGDDVFQSQGRRGGGQFDTCFNPIQDSLIRDCSWMGEGGKDSLLKICCISYNDETWQLWLTQKRSKKYINHVTHTLLTSEFFHLKPAATFVISRNTAIDCILIHNFYFSNFFQSLKVVLIIIVAILMMSAKLATLGLLKIKLFQNKGYDVINP